MHLWPATVWAKYNSCQVALHSPKIQNSNDLFSKYFRYSVFSLITSRPVALHAVQIPYATFIFGTPRPVTSVKFPSIVPKWAFRDTEAEKEWQPQTGGINMYKFTPSFPWMTAWAGFAKRSQLIFPNVGSAKRSPFLPWRGRWRARPVLLLSGYSWYLAFHTSPISFWKETAFFLV